MCAEGSLGTFAEMHLSVVVAVLVGGCLEFCSPDEGKAKWSYDDELHWPTVCREGKRQSPINIVPHEAVQDLSGYLIRSALQFQRYASVELSGVNNGHTVEFKTTADEDERPTLSGGPLRHVYQLDQLHFHWLGEHALDYIKYPLEIHFVHHRRDLNIPEALQDSDGVVVLAVLCRLSSEPSDGWALQQVADFVPGLVNISSKTPAEHLNLHRLLGPDRDSYFTYEGSLTTPACQEIVTWIVLDTPIHITDEQYKSFSKVHVGGISNFRSLQPLHGRTVYRTPQRASAGVTARPHRVVTGAVTALAGALTAASGAAALFAALVRRAVDAALSFKRQVFGVDVRATL